LCIFFTTKYNPNKANANEINIRNKNKLESNILYKSLSEAGNLPEVTDLMITAIPNGTCPIKEAIKTANEPNKYFQKWFPRVKPCAKNISNWYFCKLIITNIQNDNHLP